PIGNIQNNLIFGCRALITQDGGCAGDGSATNNCTLAEMHALSSTANFGVMSGNVEIDPLFHNSDSAWPFKLSSNSPDVVLEGGLDLSTKGISLVNDIKGNSRTPQLQGAPGNENASGVSIGAYKEDME